MLLKTFNIKKVDNEYKLSIDDILLDIPPVVYNELNGKFIKADDMIVKLKTMTVSLAGIDETYNITDKYSFDNRSILKGFTIKTDLVKIDKTLDFELNSIADYEQYHIIELEYDDESKKNTLHAYIQTPKDGRLRCVFDKSIRTNSVDNNIKYWIYDYVIQSGLKGKKFVRPLNPIVPI